VEPAAEAEPVTQDTEPEEATEEASS